ncbi:MAG: transposase [Gammaproteobacteria bacterium]
MSAGLKTLEEAESKEPMRTYSREFKEQIVKKMLLADGPSIAQVSDETGVGQLTLFAWKRRYRDRGSLATVKSASGHADSKAKLATVIETAALNSAERSA